MRDLARESASQRSHTFTNNGVIDDVVIGTKTNDLKIIQRQFSTLSHQSIKGICQLGQYFDDYTKIKAALVNYPSQRVELGQSANERLAECYGLLK